MCEMKKGDFRPTFFGRVSAGRVWTELDESSIFFLNLWRFFQSFRIFSIFGMKDPAMSGDAENCSDQRSSSIKRKREENKEEVGITSTIYERNFIINFFFKLVFQKRLYIKNELILIFFCKLNFYSSKGPICQSTMYAWALKTCWWKTRWTWSLPRPDLGKVLRSRRFEILKFEKLIKKSTFYFKRYRIN